nr:xylulose kinase-1 [Tanacetum cinerariifolium]
MFASSSGRFYSSRQRHINVRQRDGSFPICSSLRDNVLRIMAYIPGAITLGFAGFVVPLVLLPIVLTFSVAISAFCLAIFSRDVVRKWRDKKRTLLLHSLPEEHVADFHHLDDDREIWLAVKARFGGNAESKKMRKTMHKADNKTEKGEQVYDLMAGIKLDFADHAGNAAGSAKIEKKEWEVKLVESLARFDKWKESSKNLVKLINSSMSSRTKLGLGFKETIGSDEVFDLSTPSVFDPEPENRKVKSLYERFVKAGEMREVPPPITGTFMPTSYKSDQEETQETFGSKSNTSLNNTSESNDFVSCDNSDKFSESETSDFASFVSRPKTNDFSSTIDVKILPKSDVKDPSPTNGIPSCSFNENVKPPRNLSFVPAGSRNSSASISAGRSILAASRNRLASIHASRCITAGRFNKPAPFPAGRSVSTSWTNHAARPFFRPINLYFDNVHPHVIEGRNKPKGRLTVVY